MKKIRYNIALAALFFAGTWLNQEVFFLLQNATFSQVKPEKYVATFLIFFLFSFIKNKFLRYGALSFVCFLNLFQMSHIAYFGTPTQASEIALFFAEAGEVYGSLKEELNLLLIPMLLTFIPMTLLWWVNGKMDMKIKKAPTIGFLFVFYLVYNPARTFVTGNTWGRQPSSEELGGMNIYLSTSYFFGRILPAKINGTKAKRAKAIKLSPTSPFEGDIVFILGESLSSNHLSLFGYGRPTTPLLEELKADQNFHYTRGLSSGVSTDIAVAFLMNITYGMGAGQIVYNGSQCLYRLAKENGFKTHFISTQSQQQLRYIANSICPKFIDNYKSLDDLHPEIEDSNAADDLLLLDQLDFSAQNKNFVILHQRGSHSPYNLRYPKTEEMFPIGDDSKQNRVNHYDNSVYQFDKFMHRLIEKIKKRDRPTLVVYVSDHGEGLGKMGAWGHGKLVEPSIEIPILVYTHKVQDFKPFDGLPTHLNVSLLLAKYLGFSADQDYATPLKKYTILGNDIDGFAGWLELELEGMKIKNKKLVQDL